MWSNRLVIKKETSKKHSEPRRPQKYQTCLFKYLKTKTEPGRKEKDVSRSGLPRNSTLTSDRPSVYFCIFGAKINRAVQKCTREKNSISARENSRHLALLLILSLLQILPRFVLAWPHLEACNASIMQASDLDLNQIEKGGAVRFRNIVFFD